MDVILDRPRRYNSNNTYCTARHSTLQWCGCTESTCSSPGQVRGSNCQHCESLACRWLIHIISIWWRWLWMLNSIFFQNRNSNPKKSIKTPKLVSCSYGTSGGGRASGGVVGGLWWSAGGWQWADASGEERQTYRPGYTRHVIANRCYQRLCKSSGRLIIWQVGTVNIAIKQLGDALFWPTAW